jgi:hypothetical protein
MTDIKIEDNLEEAANELAEALADIQIEGSRHTRESKNYIVIQKLGTDCNIEARYDARSVSEAVTDEYDNEFIPMVLSVLVTYPSHGGAEVELALNRIAFLNECCVAARWLRDEFTPKKVYSLLCSAEDKRKRAHEKNAEVVRKTIIINGMRVGQSRRFCDGTFSDKLVSGIYDISIDKKRYTVDVSDSKVVTAVRRPLEMPEASPEIVDVCRNMSMVCSVNEIPK